MDFQIESGRPLHNAPCRTSLGVPGYDADEANKIHPVSMISSPTSFRLIAYKLISPHWGRNDAVIPFDKKLSWMSVERAGSLRVRDYQRNPQSAN